MTDRYDRFFAVVNRRRRWILAAAAALLVLSAFSLLRLRFDMDLLSQLPAGSPALRDYRSTLEAFGAYDHLLVVVTGETSKISDFADALAQKFQRLPEIGSVRYRIDLEDVRRGWLEPHRYELLTEKDYRVLRERLEPQAIEERVAAFRRILAAPMSVGARRWLTGDPFGIEEILGRSLERRYADPLFRPASDRFLSPSGDALLMILRPQRSAFDTVFAESLMASVRKAEDELLTGSFAGSGVAVGHTGSYVYALADRKVLEKDIGLYFLFAPIAVLLVFHLGLRTLRVLPFVALPLLLSTAIAFALSLLLFRSLNMISVAFAGIFYGLGVDSSIHFYSTLRQQMAARPERDPAALGAAVTATLREIGVANLVASTTTAAAFFVIGFSDFTGVSQLGTMTGIAMLLNIVGTFVLLPALVIAWGPGAVPATAPPGALIEGCGRLAEALANRRRGVLAGALLVLVAGALGTLWLRLDTDFTHLRPGAGEGERVERLLQDQFGRVDAQGIIVNPAENLEGALEAAERVAAKLEQYRGEGLLRSYSTLTTFFPSRATAERRLAQFQALPRVEAASRLRLALERSGFETEAFQGFFRDWLRDDRPPFEIREDAPLAPLFEQHLRASGGKIQLATYFVPAPGVSLSTIAPRLRADLPGTPLVVTGRALAEEEFSQLLRREFRGFLAAALLVNFLFVFVAERSVIRSLALLAPTLLALVAFTGLVGTFGLSIDPVNVIVLPLLIGLGVDNSVYLVAYVRHEGDVRAGMARGTGPLLLAVATTVVGFGSLAFSRYPALSRLGLYAGIGLVLCMLASLILVPAMMEILGRRQARES